jgi:Spy/CpxP family protein refolding chaperone
MNLNVIRRAFAGIGAGLLTLAFATTTPADASTPPAPAHVAYDCAHHGHRGDPAYDRACLTTGTRAQAAALWYSTPEGSRRTHDDMNTRRSICANAPRHGGVRAWATELVTDMTYDTYRNNKAMNAWVADTAQGDCLRMGYNDPVSGLASVNLRTLPHKHGCWVEVYYLGSKINTEVLCKG